MSNQSLEPPSKNSAQSYESSKQLAPSLIIETMIKAAQLDCCNLAQGYLSCRPGLDACSMAVAAMFGSRPLQANKILESDLEGESLDDALGKLPLVANDVLNQYTAPKGMEELRVCIAKYYERIYHCQIDPASQVIVTLGSLEAVSVVMRGLIPQGCGVVIFQPYHELYINQARIFYIKPIIFPLSCVEKEFNQCSDASKVWTVDFEALERMIRDSQVSIKAIILNSPHNPTGKVFTKEEINELCDICYRNKLYLIKDDVYEHITFSDDSESLKKHPHQFPWAWPELRCPDSIITISSISKVGTATGWRIGWIISPSHLTPSLSCIHDNLALQAPTVFQYAAQAILTRPLSFYYYEIANEFKKKCRIVAEGLQKAQFKFARPNGSYYIFASYAEVPVLSKLDQRAASNYLMEVVQIAAVTGEAFMDASILPSSYPTKFLRFACCKSEDILKQAADKIVSWYESVKHG